VSSGSTVLAAHSLSIGSIVPDEVIDISDVFRLTFNLDTSATPAAVAAVANPEVLCTR
jgi:hypothetical protein